MANSVIEFETVVNSKQVDTDITNAVKRKNIEMYDVDGLTVSGSGRRFLCDDGAYKLIAGGGDMHKFTYDNNDTGIVDNTENVGTKSSSQVVAHIDDTNNPHDVNKVDVGLGHVPNIDTTYAVNSAHGHSNKNALDKITQYGSGTNFLADDGDYKPMSGGGGDGVWGSITGDITAQTDLQQQFDTKAPSSHITDISNPHNVTAVQAGADPVGSASGVQTNLNTHIADSNNPHSVDKNDVDLGNVDNTSDINKPISTATQTALDLKYNKDEHINSSTGSTDAGKPIVLDVNGLIDHSMMDIEDKYLVGGFNPSDCVDPATGCEYPDTTGQTPGAYWILFGLPGSDYNADNVVIKGQYTFQEGDLAGEIAFDGDYLIYGETNWVLIHGSADPSAYYKLDGTSAITASFAGGGQFISNIADGVVDTDAASVAQLNTKADVSHNHSIAEVTDLQTELDAKALGSDLTSHTGDTANPHTVTKDQVGLGSVPDLDTTSAVDHVGTTDNPHSVTKVQVGLDYVIDTGDGSQYLANDGTYKTVTGGASDHNSLSGRDAVDGHPIAAVTGLQTELDSKTEEAPTDGASYVRRNEAWYVGIDSAHVGGGSTEPIYYLRTCTQVEYDALTPNANALYIIVG